MTITNVVAMNTIAVIAMMIVNVRELQHFITNVKKKKMIIAIAIMLIWVTAQIRLASFARAKTTAHFMANSINIKTISKQEFVCYLNSCLDKFNIKVYIKTSNPL